MPKTRKLRKSQTPATSCQLPATKLTWLPKKTFELEITIPKKEVKTAYKKSLEKLAKEVIIKGFRKGKVPLNLAEKQISKERIYQKAANQLLPAAYVKALSQHKLRPIITPKITPVKMKADEDWIIKAKAAEAPNIKLGNWEKAVKETKSTAKIWTPGLPTDLSAKASATVEASAKVGSPDKPNKEESQDQKFSKIFETLLKETTIEISDLVIEDELNRMLSKLLNQVNKLGLTIDQYLAANNKTQESLRKEYRETAERTLKLQFILLKIGQEKKISVSDEEIDKMIKAIPDEKVRKNLENPQQKAYIATIIRKRKTIDMLLGLV